jgi:mannose-6-phosphate isomerase-like protein (cupin superfamily)
MSVFSKKMADESQVDTNLIQPVILCGGSGTRLWPLSRAGFPKQFLSLTGNESLFQQAAQRLSNLRSSCIQVKPMASLSLQKHHHRAEHWIVVKGTAEITNGDKTFILTENQSTYIPLGEVHRLTNPGSIPLEIIEVQSGSYLGEDDIVRYEDIYRR